MKYLKFILLCAVISLIPITLNSCKCRENMHEFDNWEIETLPCVEQGRETRTCKKCGYTVYRDIDEIGHAFHDGACIYCKDFETPGLRFISNGDGTCDVAGGSFTPESRVVIPRYSPTGDVVTAIAENGFALLSFKSIALPETVTEIKDSAFYCGGGGEFTIPYHVKTIADGAFQMSCFSSISFDEGVESIGASAFGNNKFTSLVLPNSIISIGEYAFASNENLTEVKIGAGCESIGDAAFSYCSSLTAFYVDEENNNFKAPDGNLYTKDGTRLIQYAINKPDTAYKALDGLVEIAPHAFHLCMNIKSVTLPNSTEFIRPMIKKASGTNPDAQFFYITTTIQDCRIER